MSLRQNINWLLSRYTEELHEMEDQVRDESNHNLAGCFLVGKTSAYHRIVTDLQDALEKGEDE